VTGSLLCVTLSRLAMDFRSSSLGLGNVLMLPIQLLKAGIGIVQSFVGAFAVSGNVGELTDKLKELG
jgi:hypothetical protein